MLLILNCDVVCAQGEEMAGILTPIALAAYETAAGEPHPSLLRYNHRFIRKYPNGLLGWLLEPHMDINYDIIVIQQAVFCAHK